MPLKNVIPDISASQSPSKNAHQDHPEVTVPAGNRPSLTPVCFLAARELEELQSNRDNENSVQVLILPMKCQKAR